MPPASPKTTRALAPRFDGNYLGQCDKNGAAVAIANTSGQCGSGHTTISRSISWHFRPALGAVRKVAVVIHPALKNTLASPGSHRRIFL